VQGCQSVVLGGAADPMKAKLTLNFAYSFNSAHQRVDFTVHHNLLFCLVGRAGQTVAPCLCLSYSLPVRTYIPVRVHSAAVLWSPFPASLCRPELHVRCHCSAGWEDADRASPLQQELLLLLGRTLRELACSTRCRPSGGARRGMS